MVLCHYLFIGSILIRLMARALMCIMCMPMGGGGLFTRGQAG